MKTHMFLGMPVRTEIKNGEIYFNSADLRAIGRKYGKTEIEIDKWFRDHGVFNSDQ